MLPPVGFRFHPTEEELIAYYLKLKLNGQGELVDDIIGEIDVYRREPWDLRDFARMKSDDLVWYFFCRLEFLYGNTARANRKTENGFWKVTGKSRDIKAKESGRVIGTKKTVVFHSKFGDSKPVRTDWVIHEYQPKPHINQQNPIVLCKLKQKSDEASFPVASFRKLPAAFSPGTEVLQPICDNVEVNHPTMLIGDVDVDGVDFSEFADSFFASMLHSGETSTNQHWQVQSTQHDDILLMRAISEDSDASRHNRIEHESSISEEQPKTHLHRKQSMPMYTLQAEELQSSLPSMVSRERVAPHIKEEYRYIDRPRASSSAAVPKEERKITVAPIPKPKATKKPKEPLGPVVSTSHDRGCAFIRKETIMASHSPTLTSVHLRNVIVGLFLLIFFVFQLLLLH